jgi:hypothetical protein
MSNIEDILIHSWNNDVANLKPALDAEMQSRVSVAVDSLVADAAASLFGATTGNEEEQYSEEAPADVTEIQQAEAEG